MQSSKVRRLRRNITLWCIELLLNPAFSCGTRWPQCVSKDLFAPHLYNRYLWQYINMRLCVHSWVEIDEWIDYHLSTNSNKDVLCYIKRIFNYVQHGRFGYPTNGSNFWHLSYLRLSVYLLISEIYRELTTSLLGHIIVLDNRRKY